MAEKLRIDWRVRRREFWVKHVEAWKSGELSQADYCRGHGISINSFKNWRGKLLKEDEPQTIAGSLKANPRGDFRAIDAGRFGITKFVKVPAASYSAPDFVCVNEPDRTVPLILHIGERFRLHIKKDFDEETLSRVIGLLA